MIAAGASSRRYPLTPLIKTLFSVFLAQSAVEGFTSLTMSATTPKYKLYDMPVSNHGARCRLILYKKQISESEVSIVSPLELGGLKTPEYLALNPEGKMPLLASDATGLAVPESDTICRFLMHEYKEKGPSFSPNEVKSNLIARIHDTYISPIQGCIYKASPPFGIFSTREKAISELRRQLHVLEDLLDENSSPYLLGQEVSYGDAALFPTLIFITHCLPKFGVPEEEVLPPKLGRWFKTITENDGDFAKVHEEVLGSLKQWDAKGRFDTIWMAGVRDDEPATIFDKIIGGEIPAAKVLETDDVLAFKDVNPCAPAHVLVIPKHRNGLDKIRSSSPEHIEILGKLLVAAGEIARDESLGFKDGGRIVINDGPDGGQEVPHLHVHVLGGRSLTWPPG